VKLYVVAAFVSGMFVVGCSSRQEEVYVPPSYTPPGDQANITTDPIPPETPPDGTNVTQDTVGTITTPPPPPEAGQPKPWTPGGASTLPPPKQYPKATAVPGKPNRVVSPYAPYAGEVDVTGFSPGNEVRCPYTNKIFVVP
jgi:hypothetical protein